jgi:hypothetical protein
MAPRKISSQVLAVLRRALEACPVVPISEALRDSVKDLEVVSGCACGCDTVDFVHATQAHRPFVIADGMAETPEGKAIGLLVFGTNERVTSLEVYSLIDEPARLPTIESIHAFEKTAA